MVIPLLKYVQIYINYGNVYNADLWIVKDESNYYFKSDEIGVCDNSNLGDDCCCYRYKQGEPGSENAVTFSLPTEPYTSANCGGNTPCQERYKVRISPPVMTCNDNSMNQDETDIDCGGSICEGCITGKTCSIDLDCLSGLCTGGTCAVADYVNFRTSDFNYDSLYGGIGYAETCQDQLDVYGSETDITGNSADDCELYSSFNDCTTILGTTSCLLLENLPGITPEGGDGNWKLYQDDGDEDEIWLCQEKTDDTGIFIVRFDKDDCPDGAGSGDCPIGLDNPELDYLTPELQKEC